MLRNVADPCAQHMVHVLGSDFRCPPPLFTTLKMLFVPYPCVLIIWSVCACSCTACSRGSCPSGAFGRAGAGASTSRRPSCGPAGL